jgi:ZU5 domain
MRLRSFSTFTVALATFAAFGCSNDSPAAPNSVALPAAPSQSLLGGLLGGGATATRTVIPLLRTTALASDVTVSQTIGALGGTIVIPSAGLTLVVPPLAVSKPTNFAITARKGTYVAYDMEPHGTKFLLPLVATQSLVNTNARGLVNVSLSLGYYPDGNHVTSVSELLSVQVDLLRLTAIATIPHFSGYIFAGGLEDQ